MTDSANLTFAAVIAIATSLITSWVTVRLSLRQFRSERWWERQADAYSAIIGRLVEMKFVLDEWYADELHEKQLSEETLNQLRRKFTDAKNLAVEASYVADFLVSPATAKALEQMRKGLEVRQGSSFDEIEAWLAAVQDALDKTRTEAKRELIGRR